MAMDKDRLIAIFGKNLLEQESLLPLYRALSGLADHKPWECVGELLESAASLHYLSNQEEWSQDLILQNLRDELIARYGKDALEGAYSDALRLSDAHNLPADMMQAMERYVTV